MEYDTPIVSAVIPTIPGREEFLNRALNSVYEQTYPNIEVVVVNEGLPAPEQRNIGNSRAMGEFVALLDDDDEWLPRKIEMQMEVMRQHPDCPLVICHALDLRFGQRRVSRPPEKITHRSIIKSFNLSSTSSFLYRKKYFDMIGGFDTSLPSAQEYDLAIRLSRFAPVRCIQEILMVQHQSSNQISENWKKKIQGIMGIYRKHGYEYHAIDHVKTIGLLGFFTLGYVFGPNIYRVLNPVKTFYEKMGMGEK